MDTTYTERLKEKELLLGVEFNRLTLLYETEELTYIELSNKLERMANRINGVSTELKMVRVQRKYNDILNREHVGDIFNKALKLSDGKFIKIIGLKSSGYHTSIEIERLSFDPDYKNAVLKREYVKLNTVIDIYKHDGEEIDMDVYNEIKIQIMDTFR